MDTGATVAGAGHDASPRVWAGRRAVWIAPLAVVAVAAALRFLHLGVGLPAAPDVDAFKFVDAALAMVASGDWSPRSYQYPGLYTGLLAALYRLLGIAEPGTAHLLGRAVAAAAGTAVVVLTGWAARRAGAGLAGATLAAALAAVSIVAVTASRTAAADTLLAAAIVATLGTVTAPGPASVGWWRRAAPAGAGLGLAAGAKLTGLYLVPFAALPALRAGLARRGSAVRRALAAAAVTFAVAAAVFVATTPWVLVDARRYLMTFVNEVLAVQRHGQIGRVQLGWLDYLVSPTPTWEAPWLGTSLLTTAGAVTLVVGLAGTVVALAGRWGWRAALHAVFFVVYLALVSGPGKLKAARFLLPVLPSFHVLAALAWERGAAWARHRLAEKPTAVAASRVVAVVLATALAAAMLAPSLAVSVGLVARAAEPTTQEVAAEWARRHLPADAAVFLAPFFVNHLATVVGRPLSLPGAGPRQYRVPGMPEANGELRPIYHPGLLDDLAAAGAEYVVSASYFDDAFGPIPENRRYFPRSTAAYAAWRRQLAQRGERVWSVAGWEAGRLGPDVEVWRLRPGDEVHR